MKLEVPRYRRHRAGRREGGFDVVKDNIGEQPVADDEMVARPCHALLQFVRQQAHVEYHHHRRRQTYHRDDKHLKRKKRAGV